MVNRALIKKLLRDLMQIKVQLLTISIVVALGIGTLFGFASTYASLQKARESFYASHSFADLFIQVKKTPQSIIQDLEKVIGVREIESRIIQSALMSLKGYDEPILGRLISVPNAQDIDQNFEPPLKLNKLFLKTGRFPSPHAIEEVLVNEGFFNAHRFKLGAEISGLLNGKTRKFKIVGVAITPEFIYAIPETSPMPDDLHFGIFWVNQALLESAYDMSSYFNSAVVRLDNPLEEKRVIAEMDQILERFGSLGVTGRSSQISHTFLSEEIKQLKVQAFYVPIIFFFVAAFILNTVISRIIASHRKEIATLKSLGLLDREIGLYYFLMSTLIILIGVVVGLLLGIWIGRSMTQLYTLYYHFPKLEYHYSFWHFGFSVLVSFVVALLGVMTSLKKIFQLSPAEALRPVGAIPYTVHFFESLLIFKYITNVTRMAIRGLSVTPVRTLLSIVGIGFSLVLIISGLFWKDIMQVMVSSQFYLMQRETGTIMLAQPRESKSVFEVLNIDGVTEAEGYRVAGIRVYRNSHSKQTVALGYPDNHQLRKIIGENQESLELDLQGVLMTRSLAKELHVEKNEEVFIEFQEGKKIKKKVRIDEIISNFLGQQIITSRKTLAGLMQESDQINQILFRSFPQKEKEIFVKLKERPMVLNVSFKSSALKGFEETTSKYILVFAFILSLFAGALGFGVVYNNARVTLAERDWELATLEILGFNKWELFKILFSEIFVLVLAAIPFGSLLGYYFSKFLIVQMTPESFDFPFYVAPNTFLFAILTIVVAAGLSGAVLFRSLRRLDIISVLKMRS